MESIDERKKSMEKWLEKTCGMQVSAWQALVGDASFRRYFRIYTQNDSFIVMDAPPEKENCRTYVAISQALRAQGLLAPQVIQKDLEQGFLLITDFGDLTYLKILNQQNVHSLYSNALKNLANLQALRHVPGCEIPAFTPTLMWQEWYGYKEWFLTKLLALPGDRIEKLDTCYNLIVDQASQQPQVFMHRDFHSGNLMKLPNDQVGILDFQDAFIGPVTYDLVSLLRDCYISWPKEDVHNWVTQYWEYLQAKGVLTEVNPSLFIQWFDWMGLQRHLKTLLTFARKYVRDNQTHYLQFIPQTLRYLIDVSAVYPNLKPLHHYLIETVYPAWEKKTICVP